MRVSVVIAVWPDAGGLGRCIDSIEASDNGDHEIIVVVPRDLAGAGDREKQFPSATWIHCEGSPAIPVMWSIGMQHASGEVVAITTSQFVVGERWVERIRERHGAQAHAGVGGPILAPRGWDPISWATYFLRYSQYYHLREFGEVDDIPGDNASYKHTDLAAHADVIRDGFWEPEFHRVVLAAGGTLAFDPEMTVRLQGGAPFARFCRQRFSHGRHFGQDRVAGCGLGKRLFRLATSPLIPFVLGAKIAARIAGDGRRHAGAFAWSLPVLGVFILCWAFGEALGYALPAREPGDA